MGNQIYTKPRGTVDFMGDSASRYLDMVSTLSQMA